MSSDTDKQKEILGGLLTQASSNHTAKKVIGAYILGGSYKANHVIIKKFDATHQEAAAVFLGLTVRGGENQKLYKNLTILSDRILLKIESLFDIVCDDCKDIYHNTLEDSPLFTCRVCMQGSHSCTKIQQKAEAYNAIPEEQRVSGMSWLCSECHRKNDLSLTPINTVTSKPQHEQSLSGNSSQTDENDDNEPEDESDSRESPRRHDNPPTDGEICKDFKTGRCKHGISGKRQINGIACPKAHPVPCRRYCRNGNHERGGCTRGKQCRYFHLNICRSSLTKRECLNADCQYFHLKYTKRTAAPTERRPSSKPDHTYPAQKKPAKKQTQQRFRFDSITSAGNFTPYPATINGKKNGKEPIKSVNDNQSETDFLFKLMESMKEGIINQVTDKLTEFQYNLPNLIREQTMRLHVPQTQVTHLPPMTVSHHQMNLPPQMNVPPQMDPTQGVSQHPFQQSGFPPQFPGYCY